MQGSFRQFLSVDPGRDRGRSSGSNVSVLAMVDEWPEVSAADCVIAPARVKSRIRRERNGAADAEFLRRVVSADVLPTLTASPSDHWFLPGDRRWLTVPEVMRAHGVSENGSLWNAVVD